MQILNPHTLGVIGGLGPGATAHFMSLVTDMTDAATDQQHLNMIVYSIPSIPDRTRYILDNTQDNPLPGMLDIGQQLARLGADHIAIPCFQKRRTSYIRLTFKSIIVQNRFLAKR